MAKLEYIPLIVENLLSGPLPVRIDVPQELKAEAEITERLMSDIDDLKKIADRSDFVCPECGGGLWPINNDPSYHYRCYTSHVICNCDKNLMVIVKSIMAAGGTDFQ